ncbi:MAG: dephospho-CoA kinase [Burkholderiaceae bacterium]
MRYTVGLTGGIGSGKSTVADRFTALGAAIVDADVEAHRLTAPGGAAIAAIRNAFGAGFIDARGALDRAAMRTHVFADAGERRRLEAILHPMIREACDRAREQATASYVLLVVPLLFESGERAGSVQRTLVIACDEQVRIDRVMRRSGLSESDVKAIIATQMPADERISLADDVIDNSGPAADLDAPIARLHAAYLVAAAAFDAR